MSKSIRGLNGEELDTGRCEYINCPYNNKGICIGKDGRAQLVRDRDEIQEIGE